MRVTRVAVILLAVLVLQPATPALAALPASLEVVGQNALNSRGMNSALTLADTCAYVGSRADAAPLVVDIANPAAPLVVGQLTAHPGSTPRELRAVASLREIAVMFYSLNGGPNGLDFYRWEADCRTPALVGHYDFGTHSPHEFYLWQDPQRPSRVLLFVAMFGASGGALNVLDISDAARPALMGAWSVPAGYGSPPLHSIALSADGRTAFLSLWTGGLALADASEFTGGTSGATLHVVTPAAGRYRTPPGNVHSAVPVPGQAAVLTTDERYPAPFGQGCPYGTAHVVDVSNPANPQPIGTLAVPENNPSSCSAAPAGTWTSHNPTLTTHLALLSWYSAGLQMFGLDDPAHPQRLAELRPAGVRPKLRDVQLGTSDSMTWSYPVIAHGFIYVVDINQGLLVLRYHGAHEDEIANLTFAEGNSNLNTSLQATAPPASTSPTPHATKAPTPGPTSRTSRTGGWNGVLIAALFVAAVLAALFVAVVRARRRGRGPGT
jgi:hypothetical protein